MQVTEGDADSGAEPLARAQPAVERWLRVTGLVPLPAFLALHLSRELWLAFESDVSEVVRPLPSLVAQLSVACLVWVPLVVHTGLGAWLLLGPSRSAPPRDVPRQARIVSRLSAVLSFVFCAYHVRGYGLAPWLGESDARDAGFRLLAELSATYGGVPLSAAAYLLGVAATVTHACLGLHRALLLEGLLDADERRRTSARACASFGVVLFLAGAAAVIRVATGALLP